MRSRRLLVLASVMLASAAGFSAAGAQQKSSASKVVVYKSPTCGCCKAWVEHLQANGFQVDAHDVDDARLQAIETEAGVTNDIASCHTAKIGGYVVEGHVPAADIQRMLKTRPPITGISAPGMPMGSPGMEQGSRKDPYNVMAFTKDGRRTVFAKH